MLWIEWIWMPHLFLNKRSLFGLAGKGLWGRITHSEYVIRRYELHSKTGVEDRIFLKTEGLPSSYSTSADLRFRGFITLSDGKSWRDWKLSGYARASWEVPSVLFDPGTDLYGLCVWRYNLRYWADFFQIHFCWWRRIYSLSLTPFSETYELRGYVVEIYQRYIPIW